MDDGVERMNEFVTIGGVGTREEFQAQILRTVPDRVRPILEADFAAFNHDRAAFEARAERQKAEAVFTDMQTMREAAARCCGLQGEQWHNTFTTYKQAGEPEERRQQRVAIEAAADIVKTWPTTKQGLMLWGLPGRGKDHLLHAIINKLIEREQAVGVLYRYALDLKGEMMREWQRHEDPETRIEELLRESELVMIGDVHALFAPTGGVRDGWIAEAGLRLFNQAADVGKPILCCTSNFPLEGPNSWEQMVPEAICSRMAKAMRWVEVTGPDRRREAA